MQKNFDFIKILKAVLEKWWLVLICTLSCGIIAIVLTTTVIQNEYSSTIGLFTSSTDLSEKSLTVATVQISQRIVKTYRDLLSRKDFYKRIEEELKDDEFQQSVQQLIAEEGTLSAEEKVRLMKKYSTAGGCNEFEYSAAQIRSMLKVEISSDTEIMDFTVTSNDPIHSFIVAKAVEKNLAPWLNKYYPESRFNLALSAENGRKTAPNRTRNTAIGAIIGAIIGVGTVVIIFITDNRVKSEEDLYLYYDIPLLGTIPDSVTAPIKTEKKGSYYSSYYARQ